MCKCTPEIRTPFCGKPGCEAPPQKIHSPCPDCGAEGLVIVHETCEFAYYVSYDEEKGYNCVRRYSHDPDNIEYAVEGFWCAQCNESWKPDAAVHMEGFVIDPGPKGRE